MVTAGREPLEISCSNSLLTFVTWHFFKDIGELRPTPGCVVPLPSHSTSSSQLVEFSFYLFLQDQPDDLCFSITAAIKERHRLGPGPELMPTPGVWNLNNKRKGHCSKRPAQFLKTTPPQSENIEGYSSAPKKGEEKKEEQVDGSSIWKVKC